MSETEVWFDRSGELRDAIERVGEFPEDVQALAALRATAATVEHLHEAERHTALGRDADARHTLTRVFEHIMQAALVEEGRRPTRATWCAARCSRGSLRS